MLGWRVVFLMGIVAFLAGCLGGDIVTPSEARKLQSRSEAYDALRARAEDVPNSAWAAMPTSGTAQFDGVAALRVGQDGSRTRLVGDASLSVDFAAGTLDGRFDRFFGVDGSRDLAEYRGGITVSDGVIGDVRPNSWAAEYAGTLRGNGQRIVTQGRIVGDFKATPVRIMSGRSDTDDTATINGAVQPIRIDIVGEQ